jgi:hypothetical protein
MRRRRDKVKNKQAEAVKPPKLESETWYKAKKTTGFLLKEINTGGNKEGGSIYTCFDVAMPRRLHVGGR